MRLKIQDIMETSGVKFGTSGARGLAKAMTDPVCYGYTLGFLQYLKSVGDLSPKSEVAIAGDFRTSTDRIMVAVARAVTDLGYTAVNCGKIPSPAVALYGLQEAIPAIMVTGSHIPDDRNGIKFNRASGEILKQDEAAIREQVIDLDDSLFDDEQNFISPGLEEWPLCQIAHDRYVARYLNIFPDDCLLGLHIAVYQHSAVGRDLMVHILKSLGAEVTALGRSNTFIPVDTEAIRPDDVTLAAEWAAQGHYDAIVSTDGDSDRPLIADETGQWFRGDVAGILCAQYLEADSVSTPVSCNSAVEKCGFFEDVRRTRIGSPYVIAAMQEASAAGAEAAVGYEANGGFLIQSELSLLGKSLPALPTRDALILHLSLLLLAQREQKKLSALREALPQRFTASDRLKDFPTHESRALLEGFNTGSDKQDQNTATGIFGKLCGTCTRIDRTDGIRLYFDSDEVVHLRPSGNAPEFRCYNEASSAARVAELNRACIKILMGLRKEAK